VSYNDNYSPSLQLNGNMLESVEPDAGNLAAADCVVIATDHPQAGYS